MTGGPAASASELDPDVRGLQRALVLDGVWSKGMEALTTGAVLAGFALHLGAGPLVLGLLGAMPFFAQLAQFAGLRLVFRTRARRRVCLGAALASRLVLGSVAAVALAGPSPWSLPLLVALLAVSGALSAVSAISWSFWMRDLVPQHAFGRSFARRFAWQAAVSVALTAAAGATLQASASWSLATGFALLFLLGAGLGLVGVAFSARLPDAPLNPADDAPSLSGVMRTLGARRETRGVLAFVVAWTGAAFLAVPFITVFLLRELGLGFGTVGALSAVAIASALATYGFWGRAADRVGSRAVLALAVPAAALSMLALALVPHGSSWMLPLLAGVHLLSGAAFAAVDVGITKLVARQAPFLGAGGYLAGVGVTRALVAGLATLAGGFALSRLSGFSMGVAVGWGGEAGAPGAAHLSVEGFGVLFLASALLMLYAWHRVLAVHDVQGGEAREVLHEAQVELHGLSAFRGVRALGHLAHHVSVHILEQRRAPRRARR